MDKVVLGAAVGSGFSLAGKSGLSNLPKAALIGSLIATLPTPIAAASAATAAVVFTVKLFRGKEKSKPEPKEEEKEVNVDPKSIEQDSETEPIATVRVDEPYIDRSLPTSEITEVTSLKPISLSNIPEPPNSVSMSPFNTAPNSPLVSPKHSEFQFHDASPDLLGEDSHGSSHVLSAPEAKGSVVSDSIPSLHDIKSKVMVSNVSSEPESKPNSEPMKALLERARAASKRVDAMHADILKIIQKE